MGRGFELHRGHVVRDSCMQTTLTGSPAIMLEEVTRTQGFESLILHLGIVQWVERYIWDVEVARSSRAIQTKVKWM